MVCVLEDKIKAKKESKKKKKKEKQPNFQTNIQELQEKLKARIEELQGKEEFIKVMISIKSRISIDRSVAFDAWSFYFPFSISKLIFFSFYWLW